MTMPAPEGVRYKCPVCGALETFTDKGRSVIDHDRAKHKAADTVRVEPLRPGQYHRAVPIETALEENMQRIRRQREEEEHG